MAGLWQHVTLAVVLFCVCLWGSVTMSGVGAAVDRGRIVRNEPQKPSPTPNSVDRIPVREPIDMSKLWGKWYLLILASKCPYQLRHGSRMESTFIILTEETESSAISVSTNTRFNHDCWEILQKYIPTQTQGRYIIQGKKDSEPNTDVIIVRVDNAYAFILYHKKGLVTVKLYGRSTVNLSEPMLTKFEQLAQEHGMSLAYLFPFPTFGHCGPVDKKHVIGCVPTC